MHKFSKNFLMATSITAIVTILMVACNTGNNNVGGIPLQVTNLEGAISTKVQNGQVVTNAELNARVPLIAITITGTDGKKGMAICTGTLLNSTTVLTAAHCVLNMPAKPAGIAYTTTNAIKAEDLKVVLSKDLTNAVNINTGSSSNLNIYAVKTAIFHPGAFKGANVGINGFNIVNQEQLNDVAILKLEKAVDDKKYKFAKLADENPITNIEEIIAGYGVNTGNGVVGVPSGGKDSGVLRLAKSLVGKITANGSYIEIGAFIEKGIYTKICQGDSGGPDFIIDNTGNYVVTGVHSFGDGSNCGSPNTPSSSLSVAYYKNWINNYLN